MKYSIFILAFLFFAASCKQDDAPPRQVTMKGTAEKNMRIGNLPGDTAQVALLIRNANQLKKSYPDSAMGLYKQALSLSHSISFEPGMAISLLNMGNYFYEQNDFGQSRNFFYSALPHCLNAYRQDKRLLPGVYSSLGNTYFNDNQYDSAIYFYYEALSVLQKEGLTDTLQIAVIYRNIGAALEPADKDYDRSMAYSQKARSLFLYLKDSLAVASVDVNIATLHSRRSNDSALWYLNNAIMLYKQAKQTGRMKTAYNYTASIWFYKNNTAKAKAYLDSAIQISGKDGENDLELLENLACLHYFSGDFNKAIRYYKKSLQLYDETGTPKSKLNIYATLAAIYDSIGEGSTAYQYQKAYTRLNDSILNEDKIKAVNQFEVKYRSSEKDRELAGKQLLIARQQNKIQQQYLWIGGVAAGALLSVVVLAGLLYRRKQKATIVQLKASLAGEEKERLRMASELHDGIVSKLSSVRMNFDALSYAYMGGDQEAEAFKEAISFLDQSIAELRTTSQNLQPFILKKAGLATAISIYCHKIRQVTGLDIDFQLLGELPPLEEDFQLNIYRIVQELVHNIVKHSGADRALVQLNINGNRLNITVEDNGVGMPAEKSDYENGIGLFNLQSRLTLLNGSMEIVSRKGTSIYLEFDLKQFIARLK